MSQAGTVSDTSGGGNDIRTITGDSGGPVAGDPSFNVDLLGGAGVNVVGNPGTNTLTISLTGGSAAIDSLIPNSGTSPVFPDPTGALTLQGTGSITTVGGLNSLTPQLTGLTNHNVLVGAGTATITNVAPSATSGIPLVSNGASADPSFTTAQVAGGGTGITTLASGFVPSGAGTSPMVPLAYGITSAATSLVERDANQNAFANNFVSKATNVTAAGGTTVLTAASARWQNLTGSSAQTFQLPDATTLSIGSIFYFNNNTTNSTLTINDGSTALLGTIPFGGQGYAVLTVNVTTAGSWDLHFAVPANSSWGTSGLTTPSTSIVSSGQSRLTGTGSGTISILPQAAAGTYNFNLPTTAGTSGQFLTSAAGGASPMTWTSVSASGAVTQVNGNSGSVTPSSGVITVTSGASNASGTVKFTGSGSTLTFSATDGSSNTSLGANTLAAVSGTLNTAMGAAAGTAMTTAGSCTAIGALALTTNIAGVRATAVGVGSLQAATGSDCVGIGYQAGVAISTGTRHTAIGTQSLGTVSTADDCTAIGYQALNSSASTQCTAIGSQAGATNNQIGLTALGYQAANSNSGGSPTALGFQALKTNTGNNNTAVGAAALSNATVSGSSNTALGQGAAFGLSSASFCTAIGASALNAGTVTGNSNTACGYNAGSAVGTGASNALFGESAGVKITTGSFNTAIGSAPLVNLTTGQFNTSVGYATGNNLTGAEAGNISIGTGSTCGTGFSNSMAIGVNEVGTASNQITMWAKGSQIATTCFIGGIRGVTTAVNDAVAVLIDSARQLGTTSSSRRYKENIVDISNSEKLQLLRPVQFNYPQFSSDRPEYGLIAEEVAPIFPEMVVYNEEGLPETIQYHKLYGLMLSEIQRLNKRLEVLEGRAT